VIDSEGQEVSPPATSKEVRDLILKILQVDPAKRFTIYDILDHEWMTMDEEDMEKSIEESQKQLEVDEEKLR